MNSVKKIDLTLGPYPSLSGVPNHIGAVLEINLTAVTHNYHFLKSQLKTAQCAAVVKADAYGLGLETITPILKSAGCQNFFVAVLEEALSLRALFSDGEIYAFNGLFPGTQSLYSQNHITPVLNDLGQIALWQNWAKSIGRPLPAIIQIDTGMWRVGLPPQEVMQLAAEPERLEGLEIRYILSHLACSEQQNHPKNNQQLESFRHALSLFPQTRGSFANSHGIFLGPQYHFDLVRPGRSLYGLSCRASEAHGMKSAVRVYARIVQISEPSRGETIGYDATYHVKDRMKLATLSIGYADGFARSLTNCGIVYIGNTPAPVVGRVSMDLITVDVSKVPAHDLYPGGWAEIIGEHISADDLANAAGTNSREILVNLGKRYHRLYT